MDDSVLQDGGLLPDHGLARDRYIPIGKSHLIDSLLSDGKLTEEQKERFRIVCDAYGHLLRQRSYAILEDLKEGYAYFDPTSRVRPGGGRDEERYARMVESLETILARANFEALDRQHLAAARQREGLIQVAFKMRGEGLRDVRFYSRGRHRDRAVIKKWWGLRKRELEFEVFDLVITLISYKTKAAMSEDEAKDIVKSPFIRPGAVLVKCFQNVPVADMEMLHPGVKPGLRLIDKLMIGVPAIAGGIPVLLNLIPALSVLLLVIGAYLGISGGVEGDRLKQAFGAMSGIAAVGGFMMRQWVKYQRQELKYRTQVSEHLYYRNLTNNQGVFDYLVGRAEEQDFKESVIAYYFLVSSKKPVLPTALDQRMEAWLRQQTGRHIDFDLPDALGKLERLGLVLREDDRVRAVRLREAQEKITEAWHDALDQLLRRHEHAVA